MNGSRLCVITVNIWGASDSCWKVPDRSPNCSSNRTCLPSFDTLKSHEADTQETHGPVCWMHILMFLSWGSCRYAWLASCALRWHMCKGFLIPWTPDSCTEGSQFQHDAGSFCTVAAVPSSWAQSQIWVLCITRVTNLAHGLGTFDKWVKPKGMEVSGK